MYDPTSVPTITDHGSEGGKRKGVDELGIEPKTFRKQRNNAKRTRYHCATRPEDAGRDIAGI